MPPESEPLTGPASRGIAAPVASRLVCHGCGYRVPLDEIRPYRCRQAEALDNIDHALRRIFDASIFQAWSDSEQIFADPELNPFRKYRRLFYSYEIARAGGVTDSAYLRIVDRLDTAIRDVDGHGFRATPFSRSPELAAAVGLEPDRLWVKNETGNVSGSHKARHLMGIMLWLEVIRSLRRPAGTAPKLAIASCGNAALAAAEIARAAGRPLEVFVPLEASSKVLETLARLGAEITLCERPSQDPAGDPCYLRFRKAWEAGALPFTVQGAQNGLALEGGCTLVWEMVSSLRPTRTPLDHLLIQVGGGMLAAACIQGLRDALSLGLIDRLPRIHAVQTRSAFPLRRAYDRLVARFEPATSPTAGERPTESASGFDTAADSRTALRIRNQVPRSAVATELAYAAGHRCEFMWPWETPPKSIAYGILDDETYDWVAVLEGLLDTGGVPLVVSETDLVEAHRLAHAHTAIPVEPTGSAGLAGLLELQRAGVVRPGETVAVLFTGVER